MLGPVFKTVEAGVPRLAGSIPVRLRYQRQCLFGSLPPAPREARRRARAFYFYRQRGHPRKCAAVGRP